jgi:hypothetical protein
MFVGRLSAQPPIIIVIMIVDRIADGCHPVAAV